MRRHHLLPSVGRHVAGLALLVAGLTAPVAALAIDSQLDAGMPLVLKDGRIANVTVHTIPFETGQGSLDQPAVKALRELVTPMATDCFLTAQAIGHVEPGVTRDGDTLSAHRLARARADNIQATLAGLGMPQAAVASVWDWQFLEEKSQVTLWVFSLNVGDDCDGAPLEQVQAAAAPAASPATTERVRPVRRAAAEQPVDTPEPSPSELRVGDAVATPARPATTQSSTTASAAATQPAPPVVTTDAAIEPPAATQPAPSPDAAVAATTSAPPASPDPLATAAVAPAEPPAPAAAEAPAAAPTQPAEAAPAAPPPAPTATPPTELASAAPNPVAATVGSAAAALAIPFDVNSSFFPSGAGRELRGFLEGLPAAGAVEIELAGAVGTGSVRGASGEEAKRYNAWMAERRIERVAEWLEANAGNRQLTLKPRLVEDDPSREVRLRAVATP